MPIVLKSGSLNLLQTSGPVQYSTWIALPSICKRTRLEIQSLLSPRTTIDSRSYDYKRQVAVIARNVCSAEAVKPVPMRQSEVQLLRLPINFSLCTDTAVFQDYIIPTVLCIQLNCDTV